MKIFSQNCIHYIYIFVLPPVTSFIDFCSRLFYVGQGSAESGRFEQHFSIGSSPMEKIMKKTKTGFWGEILWSRLTKDEADYMENRLILDAINNGKHLFNANHDCALNFSDSCLCNQQVGNTSLIKNIHPITSQDLTKAYEFFMILTWNANQEVAHTKLFFI